MSDRESPEGDTTESFVDIQEWEKGKAQNTESRQEEKPPEKPHGEDPSQARGDHEELESWETVPESEKDDLQANEGSRDDWVQSPGSVEDDQATDNARSTLPGKTAKSPAKEGSHNKPHEDPSEKGLSVSQHENSQEGETQTLKNEENSQQSYDDHGETKSATEGPEPEENQGNQGTIGGAEADKPVKRNQMSTDNPEPNVQEESEETTLESEENEVRTHGSEENETKGAAHRSESNIQGECERTSETTDEEHDMKPEEQAYRKVPPTATDCETEAQSPRRTNLKSCKKLHPEEHQEIKQNRGQSGLRPGSAYSGGLAPADSCWTAQRGGAVTLKMLRSGHASIPPVTVPEFFSQAVSRHGEKTALYSWTGDGWTGITYLEYHKLCEMVARGLLRLGLERFGGVLILGQNSREWFIGLVGAIMAGGLAVGVDPSCSGSWCLAVAEDSQTQIILVQNDHQLQKILEIREKLPRLKAIVQWRGQIKEPLSLLYSWQQLMDLASELDESDLWEVIQTQRANQCCMVMYEESAEPRGVMLSHDNVTWTCSGVAEMLALSSQEVLLSHLPLNHMTVQMFDLWVPLCCGGTTYFAAGPWKESLLSTLKCVRPTYILGFPELWEKVRRKWLTLEKEPSLQKKVLCWARGTALRAYKKPSSLPWGYSMANQLIFWRARQALGLDNCVFCFAGIRPVDQTVVEYFRSMAIELLDLYSGNESTGMHRMTLPVYPRSRRCLKDLPGSTVRVSSTQNGRGLRLWGRHLFMGYLQKPEDTKQKLDEEGWLLTDDPQRRAWEARRRGPENVPRGSAIGSSEKRRRGLEERNLYMEL